KRVKGAMADIPFLCHFRRSIEIGNGTPYEEFSHFFKIFDQEHKLEDEIHKVLSYFDNVNLASRISCPVMVTVGLCDNVCPPSTIFAAYNKIESEKQIFVFPDFGHGGFNEHDAHKINFIKRVRN
ncbi:MAG: acetylxylan esterase, partial [Spirochaetales bacterium]|nr:acetylxylan esterase [Spirochaetales bacterium]